MNAIQTANSKSKFLLIISYLVAIIGFLFSFIGLFEFYQIKASVNYSTYPFGLINDNPWYYQSASIYATYNLISGILFLIVSFIIVFATFLKNKKLLIGCICVMIVLFIALLISGKTQ